MSLQELDIPREDFRKKILHAQDAMIDAVESGELADAMPSLELTHSFAPVVDEYGCCTYARQMFIPAGTMIVGKIHRHAHHNFIMQGLIEVATEHGTELLEAPCVFVSEVGTKRAVRALEDTIWVTVHLTKHSEEEDLDKIEDEVISPSYEEMEMLVSESLRSIK